MCELGLGYRIIKIEYDIENVYHFKMSLQGVLKRMEILNVLLQQINFHFPMTTRQKAQASPKSKQLYINLVII